MERKNGETKAENTTNRNPTPIVGPHNETQHRSPPTTQASHAQQENEAHNEDSDMYITSLSTTSSSTMMLPTWRQRKIEPLAHDHGTLDI